MSIPRLPCLAMLLVTTMPAKHAAEEALMADEGSLPITQDTVDAFTEKMLAWGETLPSEERVVMLMLLNQASSGEPDEDEEVAGFNMNLGLSPSQMARAKIPLSGGTLEGETQGPGWLRTWSQALPPKT